MKILVTGGSGFLGSHVADELSKRGHKVIIFDKKKSNWIRKDQKMFIGNILHYKKFESAMKSVDVVYHFAALADLDQALNEPINSIHINILGTVRALELSHKYKIKRFILASTIYVNSRDGGFYRSSKKAAEDYVEEYYNRYGINYTILRFGSLYGRRSDNSNNVKRIIKNAISSGKISYLGNKKSIRDYIHVLDAAKASADILKNKFKNQHIILTGNQPIKVYDFLKILAKKLKISKKIKFYDKKYPGHYITSPFTYKPKFGRKFVFKSRINFYKGISQLIDNID